ncbi:hypothetical protein IWW57_000634 [Coemansia sp. S610]|nr:hypothetical protein GGI06_005104 [Coemansia sp. S85]KAJ2031610.1 hypothetical protein IWW57_000634 [Coemansia sp. S610]KAJ2412080.1 hypothetical protein GGI10_003898 [Coemansia sp. RSA 2530]KAJ2694942.1 hypothetical protein H4218_005401 [Coemansia sp. IMI 209128]
MDCVFCRIVAGTAPCHRVLEDEKHVAFLSIYPNTPGFTVVIPKTHLSSDVLALDDSAYVDLLLFTKRVDKVLRQGLKVDRCALIVEGLMIPHAHAKLVPLHGLNGRTTVLSEGTAFTETYAGYVTSMEGPRMSDNGLADVLAAIAAGQ